MSETIIIKEVNRTPTGWFELTLGDGRKVSTKNEAFAERAMQKLNEPVEAIVNEQQNGKFTNRYLNGLDGLSESRPRRAARSANGAQATTSPAPQRSDATQERIARQWAYGRAVELFGMTEVHLPLSDTDKQVIQDTADWLLSQTK